MRLGEVGDAGVGCRRIDLVVIIEELVTRGLDSFQFALDSKYITILYINTLLFLKSILHEEPIIH